MTEQTQPELSPVAASFAEHVRALHAGLPAEEQKLLEQVFALAEVVAQSADTEGYAGNFKIDLDARAVATQTWPSLTGLQFLQRAASGKF